jgi:ribulose-5-phosphate 4-epimerase/fuculose-1-phosphate aldolase
LANAVSGLTSKGNNAVLMAKHGLITVAPNMILAFDRTALVETTANFYLALAAQYLAEGKHIKTINRLKYSLSPDECEALLGSDFERLRLQMVS